MQTVSPLNNIRSMKSGVTKKPGDFCRIKQDNGNVEAVVIDVEEKQQKVKIRTIGKYDWNIFVLDSLKSEHLTLKHFRIRRRNDRGS